MLYEFWSVGTRPLSVNGFGCDSRRTRSEVERLLVRFLLLPDTPEVFSHWLELVTNHDVKGKQVHDARLIAAMKAHGLEHLLTLNAEDFKRFEIKTVQPSEVLG